ncbi:MAG: IS66 family insertion sequence element accessory protein TnpB [Culicoidibacterales bacterium]
MIFFEEHATVLLCSRRSNRFKVLHYDHDSFSLLYKRIEDENFQ